MGNQTSTGNPDKTNTNELKEKLNFKLSETNDFSLFIESVKDEYRILEVKEIVEAYKKYQELILKKNDIRWKLDNLKMLLENELKIVNKAKFKNEIKSFVDLPRDISEIKAQDQACIRFITK